MRVKEVLFGAFAATHSRKRASSHVLVALQAVFLALCCYPVGLRNAGSAWWLLLCLAGAALGILVLTYNKLGNFGVYPEIRRGAELVTEGPYKYVRHPMYGALIMMMVGIAGYNGHWTNAAAALGIVVVVAVKAQREERLLPVVFPEYADYQQRTKRFVPLLY